jgi:CRISPR-associated protein Cas6
MTVDMVFSISGYSIPRDHGFMLWHELRTCLPWLDDEAHAAIHAVRGALASDDTLLLTKRASLVLRLPESRLAEAQSLTGQRLSLNGCMLQIGGARKRPLLAYPTLYSHLVFTGSEEEAVFLGDVATELERINVVCKFMCGKRHALQTEQAAIRGYSLMLYELTPDQSILIQQTGLGSHRKLGCGIFVPHKSIAAVMA